MDGQLNRVTQLLETLIIGLPSPCLREHEKSSVMDMFITGILSHFGPSVNKISGGAWGLVVSEAFEYPGTNGKVSRKRLVLFYGL